ncbi:hypothetical protein L5515_003123 [Caenorhabditis briggsae]|uniref:Uncharacterized protein n=1 Tax=Caenorhabditis briggsae TaxID=6238 RepID=A0AAE9JAE0_CAEBR|nr:hypothetical protein L5515_003123 [Caenorhabditis briggsae]
MTLHKKQLLLLKFFFLSIPLFIYHYLIKCDINASPESVVDAFFIHLAPLIISIRLAKIFSTDIWDTVAIAFIQIIFSPISYFATLDLYLIYRKQVEWTDLAPPEIDAVAPTVAVVEVKQKPEAILLSLLPCPKCDGCKLEYTPERVALIIREWGHSICTDCAKKAAYDYYDHYLHCPHCSLPSVINGNLKRLHTNFSLIKFVSEIAKIREELEKAEVPEVPPEIID